MAGTTTFQLWPDVSTLPVVEAGHVDLYLRFPVPATAERARKQLRNAGYHLQQMPNAQVYRLPDLDPLPTLRTLTNILTPAEREETYALVRPGGEAIEPADRILAMNVRQLRDRFSSTWLLEILRSQRLAAVFQPIVSADNAAVFGYEGLVRGYYEEREISPSRMIEVARNVHVMGHFDALAMQVVLTEAARSKIETSFFINCAPGHIYDPELRIREIRAFCDRLGLDSSKVVLEVTETERNDPEQLGIFIRACRHHKFRVALDDLGAGYSSLGMLNDLRPDIVKIDRGLVTAINADPYRALILSNILEATRILGVPTVIEGIETETEMTWARSNGATYLQGNHVGAPAPLAC